MTNHPNRGKHPNESELTELGRIATQSRVASYTATAKFLQRLREIAINRASMADVEIIRNGVVFYNNGYGLPGCATFKYNGVSVYVSRDSGLAVQPTKEQS